MAETKADAIRAAIRKNPEDKPKAIIEKLKKSHADLSVSPQEVSTYRSLLKSELNGKGKAKVKRGRPKGSKNKVGRPRVRPTDSMVRLEGITKLKEAVEALGSKEVARQLLDVL
ncbi:MAG: hypothetical protein AB7K24_15105 [Gemmataceae bacterium]